MSNPSVHSSFRENFMSQFAINKKHNHVLQSHTFIEISPQSWEHSMIHTSDWLLYVSRIRGTGKKKRFQLEIIHTCFPELDTQYGISAAGGAWIKTTSIADKNLPKWCSPISFLTDSLQELMAAGDQLKHTVTLNKKNKKGFLVMKALTWGRGQQAHCPESFLQQVVPPGHIVCLSHFSSFVCEVRADSFSTQRTDGRKPSGSSQVSASRLQTLPWGQQCRWSSQHTAWKEPRI